MIWMSEMSSEQHLNLTDLRQFEDNLTLSKSIGKSPFKLSKTVEKLSPKQCVTPASPHSSNSLISYRSNNSLICTENINIELDLIQNLRKKG